MKYLISIIIIITFGCHLNARDYYYSKGEKIYLNTNPYKVCILVPKDKHISTSSLNLPNNTTLIESRQSNLFEFKVIENIAYSNNETANMLSEMKIALETDSIIVLPCYQTNTGDDIILTELIDVKLYKQEDISKLQILAEKMKLQVIKQDVYMPSWWMLSITSDTDMTTLEAANALYETGLFAEAYPVVWANEEISWDKDIEDQWGLYNAANDSIDINVSSAWNMATGKNVNIAIVDSGVDSDHIDLKENIASGCDAVTSTENVTNPSIVYTPHATQVAGIAAAVRNNGIQIAGVAPEAKIISISSGKNGIGFTFGINWAWKNGADIINCSWGYPTTLPRLEEALDSALYRGRNGKGCIIIKSAGNSGINEISYPGNCNNDILTTGAINNVGNKASFSNYGTDLDVVAPGVSILSTDTVNTISFVQGTSYAAPFVSGLAALILERNPDLTRQQVCDIIEQNTTKVGDVPYTTVEGRPNGTWNEQYGYGLIDAYRALKATPRKKENY